jgi:hypothetical protein
MFVFGGANNPSRGGNFQSFYSCAFDFFNSKAEPNAPLYRWEKIKSEAPKARDSHSCVAFDKCLIMFGGSATGRDDSFGEIQRFCLLKKEWAKLSVDGVCPRPREAHIC